MLSRLSLRTFRSPLSLSLTASFADAVANTASADGKMTFNFSLPHVSIFDNERVFRVTVPGLEGEYSVNAGHSPIVSEMQAGVVKVYRDEGSDPEQWFVSGGFSFTHEPDSTFITAVEACQVSDLDEAEVRRGFAESQSKVSGLAEGSVEQAEAIIERETYRQLALALNVA